MGKSLRNISLFLTSIACALAFTDVSHSLLVIGQGPNENWIFIEVVELLKITHKEHKPVSVKWQNYDELVSIGRILGHRIWNKSYMGNQKPWHRVQVFPLSQPLSQRKNTGAREDWEKVKGNLRYCLKITFGNVTKIIHCSKINDCDKEKAMKYYVLCYQMKEKLEIIW